MEKVVRIMVCMTVLKIVNLLASIHQLVGIVTSEQARVFNWGEVVVIATRVVGKILAYIVSELLITIPRRSVTPTPTIVRGQEVDYTSTIY